MFKILENTIACIGTSVWNIGILPLQSQDSPQQGRRATSSQNCLATHSPSKFFPSYTTTMCCI